MRSYSDAQLDYLAFPLGGLGAGMVALAGNGMLTQPCLRHDVQLERDLRAYAALSVPGAPERARVLEAPMPEWKCFARPGSAYGIRGTAGLPRCSTGRFTARFPFAELELAHEDLPLQCTLEAWSPFVPGDADASGLPVAALGYRLRNAGDAPVEALFSFVCRNPFGDADGRAVIRRRPDGVVLGDRGSESAPQRRADFAICCDEPELHVDAAWFRGAWFDADSLIWRDVRDARLVDAAPHSDGPAGAGVRLAVPLRLAPGEEHVVDLRFCWYAAESDLRVDLPEAQPCCDEGTACGAAPATGFRPYYAARFAGIDELADHWREHHADYRARSAAFSAALQASDLPEAALDAVAANLAILKSPTVLRQHDGRLWAWEGCNDTSGCCHGSCTHVWNYERALPALFPALARDMRETEFGAKQDARGHQQFRVPLPIQDAPHNQHAAADGQLGAIVRVYDEWRRCGDQDWLRGLWPAVRRALDYAIETWDPDRVGGLVEPHHNTYDIEFWGPDGMCGSFYLAALAAAVAMGSALGEEVDGYRELHARAAGYLAGELSNGEYLIQRVRWRDLRASVTAREGDTPEATALREQEGPKYQYGTGCLADGVLGCWLAEQAGLAHGLDDELLRSHLQAVYRYNFRERLGDHANTQRAGYALGDEAGLLLCTWPHGGEPSLPFVYSHEVWTGIEYHVAGHLILHGRVDEGLRIIDAARSRYDGRRRNPFDEYECGHYYARALSSFGLLQSFSGARYDAVERTLHLAPRVAGDCRFLFCCGAAWGLVGVRDGEPFVEWREGEVPVERIAYQPCEVAGAAH